MDRQNVHDQGLTILGPQGGLNQPILGWQRQPDQAIFEAGPIFGNIELSRGRHNADKDDNNETPMTTIKRLQQQQQDADNYNQEKAPTTTKPTEAATRRYSDNTTIQQRFQGQAANDANLDKIPTTEIMTEAACSER